MLLNKEILIGIYRSKKTIPITSTYSLNSSVVSVNEGSSVIFTITTTNVPNGTTLYWTTSQITGNVDILDFNDTALSGTAIITNNTGTITRTLSSDQTSEGVETFQIQLRTGSTSGPIVATSDVITINDTSTPPTIPCGAGTQFTGGQSYPSTNTVTLGSGTGTVTLTANAIEQPDRFIVLYNGNVVVDTGYRGASRFNIGGGSRASFNSSLNGDVDPITGLAYPNAGATDVAADGYPIVRSPGNTTATFNKTTSSPTFATVNVYAPGVGTGWDFTLGCPV